MARPATLPRWGVTAGGGEGTNNVAPTSGAQDTGYATGGVVPTSGVINWLFRRVYEWLSWAGKGTPVDPDDLATKGYVDLGPAPWTGFASFGANVSAGTFPTSVSKSGGRLFLNGTLHASADLAILSVVCTLPAGFRPSAMRRVVAWIGSPGSTMSLLTVNPDGTITIPAGTISNGSEIYLCGISCEI